MLSKNETVTIQTAASYLGVSRQHLVNLIDAKLIPFHTVGSQPRVMLRDLLAYEKRRDAERKGSLDKLAKRIDEVGLYDSDYVGES